ncbi:hypothetical protein QFC20_004289 [Naganishia adeliensis]|uniref:Uncharacterized protein n=1 Tax=Naganishia adeliensis TaxID=92952 RepID=A0ACC2W1J8_9TREE|nr:hypothetical protein QFC20_004289 [Naganishia adeliensis]
MALLDNSRANHHIHLASLGTLFLCGLLTMAMSAGFLDESKAYNYGGHYNRYHLDAYKLLVAASVLTIIGTVIFVVFNTVGSLFKGMKNSLMVEIVVFGVLLTLNLGE